MAHDGQMVDHGTLLADLTALTDAAILDARAFGFSALQALRDRVAPGGKVSAALIEEHQHAAHATAWIATYAEALARMREWIAALSAPTEADLLILQTGFGEYLAQMQGGIPMAQGEFARPQDLGLTFEPGAASRTLIAANTAIARQRLAQLVADGQWGDAGLDDTLVLIRDQFRRFADTEVAPFAHQWHLDDTLIPMDLIAKLADLGVFGLTIPEDHGGLGLPKSAMVVVSEELSRGYIGVGSLGTRSEIAAELILCGGTDAQKAHWLPRLASGEVLPTAVFTEPNTGSDLGALKTRAVRDGDGWSVTGNKTWITHAARTHLMTLMARTDPDSTDWRGLSMFLAEKTPGTDADPFPTPGMSGGEIEVLGYRGMKEYDIAFDGFQMGGDALLGGQTGQGFKHLMQTFESARIQTAARAVGVAQNAADLALRYALDRTQFGKPLIAFPRVAGKIAMMAVEIMLARQLTLHSAARKDSGERCDLEAGMAKLLAARVAWTCADQGLQIHGGNGFALEYQISRVLCDARILNIFEGAAEIQAQVIARRLLD
jgi:(2S)-methylsuccinyl-CoA dehydrogenase